MQNLDGRDRDPQPARRPADARRPATRTHGRGAAAPASAEIAAGIVGAIDDFKVAQLLATTLAIEGQALGTARDGLRHHRDRTSRASGAC